jgi:hypothetical protein
MLAAMGCSATRRTPSDLAAERILTIESAREHAAQHVRRQFTRAQVSRALGPADAARFDAVVGSGDCSGINDLAEEIRVSCVASLETTQDQFRFSQTATFLLTAAGAIAGSVGVPALTVAAPAANAVWISALGGVAGAANAMNLTASEVGASPEKIAAARQGFLAEWMPLMDKYADKLAQGDCPGATAELEKARTRCLSYLYGITDATKVSALTTTTTTTTTTTMSTSSTTTATLP